MTTTTITIDVREARLLDAFAELGMPISNPEPESAIEGEETKGLVVKSAPLQVGDVMITAGDVELIFERKTGADLTSSIRDGRYREQKKRMLDNVRAHHHVTYIIENKASCTLSASVYEGIIVNTMYRDGMHIVYTANVKQTAEWLIMVANKIAVDPSKYVVQIHGGSSEGAYVDNLKVKSRKCENIDVKTCYILQLSQIPGISTHIATAIADVYPSMHILLKELTENPNPDKVLCKIPLIGAKKAKVILQFMAIT